MSVYVVAHVQVHDASGYAEYACAFRREFPPGCGVQVIAADDAALPLEGAWPHVRTVILRFEDADAAVRWHGSARYQKIAKLRLAAATSLLALVRGID